MATNSEIVKQVLASMKKAQRDYLKMSNGCMCNAEHWITARVAESLWRLTQNAVLMESDVTTTLKEATRKPMRPPKGGRYDIVLYKGNGTPKAIIEIKSALYSQQVSYKSVISDVNRVAQSINSTQSIEFGVVGYGVSCHGDTKKQRMKKLEGYAENLDWRAREEAGAAKGLYGDFKAPHIYCGDDGHEYSWMVGCIRIFKRGSWSSMN